MRSQTLRFVAGAGLFAIALFALAPLAHAQTPQAQPAQSQATQAKASQPPQDSTAEAPVDQVPRPIPPAPPEQLKQPYWASIGGFEADTHKTGYGFFGPEYVKPVNPNLAWLVAGNANYLYYEYPNGSGMTNVRAPGLALRGGVKFGDKNYVQLSAGPAIKFRHIEVRDGARNVIRSSDDTQVGLSTGADVWVDPTRHNNVYGIFDYNTADNYIWSRLAYKEQLGNYNWSGPITPYLGAEIVGQGDRDIRSTQYGAFLEFVHVPSSISIMVRGGYKRSTFAVGPAQTGPWVAVGFYQRLR